MCHNSYSYEDFCCNSYSYEDFCCNSYSYDDFCCNSYSYEIFCVFNRSLQIQSEARLYRIIIASLYLSMYHDFVTDLCVICIHFVALHQQWRRFQYTPTHACTQKHTYIHTRTHTYGRIHAHVCMYARTHIRNETVCV